MTQPLNHRILLIDDRPSIHEDFCKILTGELGQPDLDAVEASLFGEPVRPSGNSFELDSAYQGREGADLAAAAVQAGRPYALAFVDMRMPPGWDGMETVAQLWRIDPQLQIVICTAYSDHPWEQVIARLDARDRLLVLKKPFELIEVSQLARTLTAKWEMARQAGEQIQTLARAVEDLKASEAAVRESHRELETFVHSLSHDVRSPLTAMSSFSHLLARELEGAVNGKALHYLSRIRANAERGEKLIDALLRLDGVSRSELRREPVELGGLAREMLAELRAADPGRPLGVVIEADLWANADLKLVRMALGELLQNAWKFTLRDAPARIEVGRRAGPRGEAVFFVRDNGRGFDMAYAGQLFHQFQRLHLDDGVKGIGAGLVVANRIVSRHGGRLWAESAPGAGTSFYFTLGEQIPQPA